jgi:cytochrome c oxidase cbb3-type subunit 3
MSRLGNGRWLNLLMLLAGGCDLPGQPKDADRPVPADQVNDFDVLYGNRCAGCHGAEGKNGPAPPLNDPLFLAIVSDADLLRVIQEGRSVSPHQRTPMPAFARAGGGPFTDDQVQVLALGIKKRWPTAASGITPPPYVSPSGGKGGDTQRGALLFARACAGCHGPRGEGEKDGRILPGGPIHDPAFLALISDQALRRLVITGRPDLGMPAYDGVEGRGQDFRRLSSAEIDDLVALLSSWRRGEAAETK